jgi:hypothetical protein
VSVCVCVRAKYFGLQGDFSFIWKGDIFRYLTCYTSVELLYIFEQSLQQHLMYYLYPKVSGLAAWSENCKWYSSLPLDAVVSLFYVSV